jgi:large subunit ribosomal protein L18
VQHQRQILRQRQRRAIRVRNRLKRDAQRPRLTIFRSHQNIYAQIIDDAAGKTLVAASSRDQALRQDLRYGGNKTAAVAVGKALAQRALEAGVQEVVFDRRDYKFHGRVAALAQAAREAGLKF